MTKLTDRSLIDLTAQIFEAAADASGNGWSDVYKAVSKLCSSGPGSLYVLDKRKAEFRTLADTNPPGFIEDINTKYLDMIPYRSELLSLKTGQSLLRSEAMPDAEFERTDLYQQHMRKYGIFHTLQYCLYDGRDRSAGMTFTRPASMKDFDPKEMDTVAALIPLLQRALTLHATVVKASEKGRLTTAGLESLSLGIIIVPPNGKVYFMNRAAEEIVNSRSGIRVTRHGNLECVNRADSEILRALIASAFEGASYTGQSGAMRLHSADGESRLAIRVTPLRHTPMSPFSSSGYAAILLSKKPRPVSNDIRNVLSDVYGLTTAEAAVATLLASGRSLAEICEEIQITENTARTHLKRVFSKTGTNRQSALISLILSFPASIEKI